jgi:hypothetical protein
MTPEQERLLLATARALRVFLSYGDNLSWSSRASLAMALGEALERFQPSDAPPDNETSRAAS